MSCYGTNHSFTTTNTVIQVGAKCDCGQSTWETRESSLEKEVQSMAELIDELRKEKIQLVGMILRIRKAFYQVGTTKAMRETMKEVSDEFRIMRGEIKQ